MTSRLRRMLLVNSKTSGTICSGSITEVDPRGGACVTGFNGVGKTTTLQLLPLFFGYSPNQIVHSGGNLEPMLRFVLPHPQCALVFEYQRGPEPTDIHQVVIRRQSGNDAPEYRFIAGAFNKAVFIAQLDNEPAPVFLDDEGCVAAATRQGMQVSPKLNAAAFRNVILNLRSVNKDADAIRRLTNQFSFSARSLPYLDRLVASVVKEKVDFRDLTDVAVTMVLEQMGGFGKPGSNQQRLPVKQGKEQIERWLRNRDACERAFKLREDVDILRERLKTHRQLVWQMGELRGDVRQLKKLLAEYTEQTQEELGDLERARAGQVSDDSATFTRLNEQATESARLLQVASTAHNAERDRKQYFDDEEAIHWTAESERLPILRSQSEQMLAEIESLTKEAEGISRQYDQEIGRLDTTTANTKVQIQAGKQVHADHYASEVAELEEQEQATVLELEGIHQEQMERLHEVVRELDVRVGAARAQFENPKISGVIEKRLDTAREALTDHMAALAVAVETYAVAKDTLGARRQDFAAAEAALSDQNLLLDEARTDLEIRRQQLNPPQGTLHAAFAASTDDNWKRSVARVIDPVLLGRTDLHPQHVQDVALGLYGWDLDLSALQTPAWANDEAMQALVVQAEATVAALEGAVQKARTALEGASVAQMQAQQAHNEVEATLTILKGRTAGLKLAVSMGEEDVSNALARTRDEAQSLLAGAEGSAAAQRAKLSDLAKAQVRENKDIATEYRIAREQALARKRDAESAIDVRLKEYDAQQKVLRAQLETQRDNALTEKGVDVKRLSTIKANQTDLAAEFRAITDKAPVVQAFGKWLQGAGPARLIELQTQAFRYEEQNSGFQSQLSDHTHAMGLAKQRYNTAKENIEKRLQKQGAESQALDELDEQLRDYTPMPGSRMTLDNFAGQLSGRFSETKTKLSELVRDIETRYRRIEVPLVAQESAVKEFVLACLNDLGAETGVLQRAERLIQAYDRIGREVLSHVNGELSTILESIAQFRSRILTFESEVKAFNKRLQAGLNGVVNGFTRIRDFQISVVTDFEQLDFMGKLKALDDVVRYHREQNRATHSIEVPPATSAYALRDFMDVIGSGQIELDLSAHITLSGSINDDGNIKPFHRESELKSVSSNGLTAITLITLLAGLLNVIRGNDDTYIPWVTDEVGKYDGPNFQALMQMLRDNRIDVVTASPSLTPAAYKHFARRYLFKPHGSIAVYRPAQLPNAAANVQSTEIGGPQ